jgi:hypothetical protein
MKKLIVMTALALFGAQLAKAQFSKGDVLLGGNLNVHTKNEKVGDSDKKPSTTSFGISPKVGLALNQHWMVGIFAETEFSNRKTYNGNGVKVTDKTTSILPGVFVRNYHTIGSSNFVFFGEANAAYHYAQTKRNSDKINDTNGFQVNVQPGIGYFVTKRFMIEGVFGGLRYAWDSEKDADSGVKTKYNSFDFTFPKEFSLGVNFIF